MDFERIEGIRFFRCDYSGSAGGSIRRKAKFLLGFSIIIFLTTISSVCHSTQLKFICFPYAFNKMRLLWYILAGIAIFLLLVFVWYFFFLGGKVRKMIDNNPDWIVSQSPDSRQLPKGTEVNFAYKPLSGSIVMNLGTLPFELPNKMGNVYSFIKIDEKDPSGELIVDTDKEQLLLQFYGGGQAIFVPKGKQVALDIPVFMKEYIIWQASSETQIELFYQEQPEGILLSAGKDIFFEKRPNGTFFAKDGISTLQIDTVNKMAVWKDGSERYYLEVAEEQPISIDDPALIDKYPSWKPLRYGEYQKQMGTVYHVRTDQSLNRISLSVGSQEPIIFERTEPKKWVTADGKMMLSLQNGALEWISLGEGEKLLAAFYPTAKRS